MRWRLSVPGPSSSRPAPLNAQGNEVVIETLELAHEGFELE